MNAFYLINSYLGEDLTSQVSIPIGKHNHVPDSEFDPAELALGIKIELEHTDNLVYATAIAKDHLSEIRDYYTRLIKMEKEAKDERAD